VESVTQDHNGIAMASPLPIMLGTSPKLTLMTSPYLPKPCLTQGKGQGLDHSILPLLFFAFFIKKFVILLLWQSSISISAKFGNIQNLKVENLKNPFIL
jgi:hypothetical protein